MSGKCKECGKELWTDEITHCSNKCLFTEIQNSTSVSGTPVEIWDEDEESPWV